jgi:hypothetical protein
VPPYEPRIFPLPDDVYEKMLKAMPEGHPFPPYSMAPKKLFTKDNEMVTSPFLFVTISDLCEIPILQGKGEGCYNRSGEKYNVMEIEAEGACWPQTVLDYCFQTSPIKLPVNTTALCLEGLLVTIMH